jgi:hypothetical protein
MNAGIICDLSFDRHIGLKNYYFAIKNIFGNVKLINNYNDLYGIDILFIGNEHFFPHRKVWENETFIKYCNNLDIKVIVFSVEKIFNSKFPHNEDIQKSVKKFENLYQFAFDIEDLEILNCKLIRGCMSKEFLTYEKYEQKIDKCIFLGSTDCSSYYDRKQIIKEVEKYVEVIYPDKKLSWNEYFKELSKYRFVLSPLGNANGLNLRFYEILLANSIPIQQIKNNTFKYYDLEKDFDDCIFFEKPEQLSEKINNMTLQKSFNNIYLEDYIKQLLISEKIFKD